ncbi:hypothetical protein G7Z17_g4464 [Cylindrodendrum hubeiense]|uniref:Cas1p 10 TM acyl transferase domain-containing protein n=1 Tax=Cylindrodendrum hubeiense TaxID=595255 RepID=A0A9P5LIA2_9HYPO|nr:hypothetical protein G7Z17_g4464 [Cylindrodendrum hubeiense]
MLNSQPAWALLGRVLPVSFAIILLLAVLLESLATNDDPYRCRALLNNGSWIHEPDEHGDRRPFDNWQPDGCMLRTYTKEDIHTCFGDRYMVFSGDSTTRQVFWAMARLLDRDKANHGRDTAPIHDSYDMEFDGIRIKQVWNPFLETGTLNPNLTHELNLFSQEKHHPVPIEEQKGAGLIMLGAGSWYVLTLEAPESLTEFQVAFDNVTDLLHLQDMPTFGTSPMDPIDGVGNEIFVAPIAVPFYDDLPGYRTGPHGIHKGEVEAQDVYLREAEAERNFRLLGSFPELSRDQPEAMVDRTITGFHVIDSVAEIKAQILLNLRCNAKLDKLEGYPYNKTCCTDYGSPTLVQTIIVGVTVLYVMLCVVLDSINIVQGSEPTRNPILTLKVGIFAAALLFCYFADRTHLFAKGNKELANKEFITLVALGFILLLVTIRKTQPRQSRTPAAPVTATVKEDAGILSRDQTEEWKGWMQAVILIYHWTGASVHLGIYMFVRLLVASYLFQTGYGHTIYFLAKKDFSFRRVAAVMLRLNILSCVLPYVMNTDYMFYYFAPLVSYWFVIVYLTMAIGSQYNDNSKAVLSKIAIALVLNYVIMEWSPVTSWIFSILQTVFRIQWNLHEWEFRVGLDGIVVFVGMLAGLVQQRIQRDTSWLTSYKTAIVPALIAIGGYATAEYHFEAKQDYNRFHPFMSFLPILGFIILRNAFTPLRNYYSTAMAWLGRCSLETFILQYHIYLAADTKGVILLDIFRGGDGSLFGDRWRDLAIVVPIFIWLSHCVAEASVIIVKMMTDKPRETAYDEEDEELKIIEPSWGGYSLLQGHKLDRISRFCKSVGSDLRMQVAVMVGAMWLLNWISTSKRYSDTTMVYGPLSSDNREFRLLSLLPGALADEIRCQLHIASLDDSPSYEALSYTWGSLDHEAPIYLNGRPWTVTANLESALRRLRRGDGAPRTLWVDALCINQNDIAERGQQVGIMMHVYASAYDVLVWLGEWTPAGGAHGQLRQAISQVFDGIGQLADGEHLKAIALFAPFLADSASVDSHLRDEMLSALQFVMNNPYWDRAWVVQETAVASHATVLCGEFSAEFDDFLSAAVDYAKHITSDCCFAAHSKLPKQISTSVFRFAALTKLVDNVRDRFRGDAGPLLTLWELLYTFRSRHSTDPRDKVYAFSGLVTELTGEPLPIDYSLDTVQLFKDVAFRMIKDMGNLSVLASTGTNPGVSPLPSWAPDWTCYQHTDAIFEDDTIPQTVYSAAGQTSPKPAIIDKSILALSGVKIDVVSEAIPPGANVQETLRDWHAKATSIWGSAQDGAARYESTGGWEDAFLRTSIRDVVVQIRQLEDDGNLLTTSWRSAQPEDITAFEGLISKLDQDAPPVFPIQWEQAREHELWLSLALTTGPTLSFFATTSMYMGIGPNAMRAGDEVWVLMGSPFPFVLRNTEGKDPAGGKMELRSVVGPCYLHGVMKGEAVRDGDALGGLEDMQMVGLV